MPSRDYKGHSIRYVCSEEDGRWTASAVTLTADGSSIIGDPIFLQETFPTEAEAVRSVIKQAEASIDQRADTPPPAP